MCLIIHRKLEDIIIVARFLSVKRLNGVHFEVVNDQSYIINLEEHIHSYRQWKVYDLPYKHAYATILPTNIKSIPT